MFKSGVDIAAWGPQIVLAYVEARNTWGRLFNSMDTPFVVTSGNDGIHGAASLHYVGNAMDIRIRDPYGAWALTDPQARSFEVALKSALGEQFDVVWERDHFHVEFQPKRR